MDPRLRPKSDLHVFLGYVLLLAALVTNPLAIMLWQSQGWLPPVPSHHFHPNDLQYLLPGSVALLLGVVGGIMVWAPKRIGFYLNDSLGFNCFISAAMLAIMFSLNVVQPGQLKILRILYILGILFFLTNSLYLAVVKKRPGREVPGIYRNAALSVYAVMFLLLLLEGIFMFQERTHRFNGTLASRAWFLHHWELNAEGYRDAGYDSSSVAGRRKILVIGDSFVAGHGVADPKDRFSDQLGQLAGAQEWRAYNLGVGGSDTRDENKRLREFPFKPDILIFSWYPNDIEQDGERAGLILQHARSYHDIWGPLRYFARRSYLWNHIYWQYPHPDELIDYFGYIQQCFAFLKVRAMHLKEIDRLVAYGDSLHVPMAAVVFPFLEQAEGSAFATAPIEERFRAHGVPTVSVRDMLLGKPAADYVVNMNDPHPNERLHRAVAEALHGLLQQQNAYDVRPAVMVQDTVAPPPPKKSKPKKRKPKSPSAPDSKPD